MRSRSKDAPFLSRHRRLQGGAGDFNESVKRDKESYTAWTYQGLALEKSASRQAFAAFAHASSLNPSYRPAQEGMRRTSGPVQRTT